MKEENKDLEDIDVLLYKVSKIISDIEYELFKKIKPIEFFEWNKKDNIVLYSKNNYYK